MRIAFVGGFAFSPKGTMQARAFPLGAELVRLGHQVTMFLTPYDNPDDSGREWTKAGVRICNMKTGSSPRAYPRLLFGLWKAIGDYEPQLTHIFKPKGFAGAVGSFLVMKGLNNIVVDCDDWEGWGGWNDVKPYPWLLKEFIDRQERWLIRRAPAVTVASRALNDRVSALRNTTDDVFYVPNGVASSEVAHLHDSVGYGSQATVRRELDLPEGPLILYSGHFEPGEDAMFFCRSAVPVAERNHASIVLVGDGPDIREVRKFFSERHSGRVHFFPRLPHEQFLKVVYACDVATFPCPNTGLNRSKCSARVIDYMMMGKPVLMSAVGQAGEYLVDGESGMLVPPGDEHAFGTGLQLLLDDSKLRTRLGRNAQYRIRQNFSWSGAPLQQCLAAYDHLASKQQ
jgi:glycosyltransferase involved in cell wall biosynthesis